MAYTPQTWHDSPATDTPITAARLAYMENGIANAQSTADSALAGSGGGSGGGPITASQISDSTTVGRQVITAADAPTARLAIGAGTSSLAIGTTSTTAKAGNYAPASTDISDSTTVGRSLLTAASTTAARSAIGATSTTDVTNTIASMGLLQSVRESSGVYGNRPASTAPVIWIGPDSPATGGSTAGGSAAAVNGLDVWFQTS